MLKKFKNRTYSLLFIFTFSCSLASLADSEFSATPDYSYDSFRSRDTFSLNRDMNSSLSRNTYNSSSRTFSGNVLINRSRSSSAYSPQQSGYTPSTNGFSPQMAGSNYGSQKGSNSAYYRTNPYKY